MRFTPGSGLRPYLRKVKRRGLTRCFVTCGVRFPPQTRGRRCGVFHRRPWRGRQWFRERRGEGPRQGSMVASPRAGSRPSQPEPCPQLLPQCRLVLASPQVSLGREGSGGGAGVDPGTGFRGLHGLLVGPSCSERAVLYFLGCCVIPSSPRVVTAPYVSHSG